ncbi:LOW QUALITY PROTEIN: prostaglandin D2 receptor 2 [Thomomys bottae]
MMANTTQKLLRPLLEQMSRVQSHSNSSIRSLDHVSVLLHALALALGLGENGLVLFLGGCRMRPTVITTWVLHLALSDLLDASLPFFTSFLAAGHSWELGTTFCKLHSSIFFFTMFASGFLLSAISLDRWLQVVRPVWAHNHRSGAAASFAVSAVVAAFALCWGPYHVLSLLEAHAHAMPALRPPVWRGLPLATSLAFFNSVINPLLYLFICPNVLHKLRDSLHAVLESVLLDDSELGSGTGSRPSAYSSTSNLFVSGCLASLPCPTCLRVCVPHGRGVDPQQGCTQPRDNMGTQGAALNPI